MDRRLQGGDVHRSSAGSYSRLFAKRSPYVLAEGVARLSVLSALPLPFWLGATALEGASGPSPFADSRQKKLRFFEKSWIFHVVRTHPGSLP
jgi:hypothetical protein